MNNILQIKKTNTTDEINMLIENLFSDYFQHVTLVNGKGRFSNLFWWQIGIKEDVQENLRYRLKEYSHILLMPYRITKEDLCKLSDKKMDKTLNSVEISNTFSTKYTTYWGTHEYNLDPNSGNIHIPFDSSEWLSGAYPIQQLVLVRKNSCKGPKYSGEVKELSEYVRYNCGDNAIFVPKMNYYPEFDNSERPKSLEDLLKGFCDVIFDNQRSLVKEGNNNA